MLNVFRFCKLFILQILHPKEIKAMNFKDGNIMFALQSVYYNIIKVFSSNLKILAELSYTAKRRLKQ